MKSTPAVIEVNRINKTFRESFGPKSFKSAFVDIGKKITGQKEQAVTARDFTALKDISFKVKQGEFFGIVGRNGSGKSTLLKIIAGVYVPSGGTVEVNGKITPFIELGVGFNPELSGRDNVYLNGALLGFTRKQVEAMYADIVRFAELEEFMEMKLKNYSSGMQVRLAFSVAIRAKSEILIIDEVLAVGDAAFQRKCYDYFMDLKKQKSTVVLVTHDMGAIRQYCDRAVLIDSGRVAAIGNAEKIAQAYQKMFSEENEVVEEVNDEPLKRWGDGKMLARSPTIKITEKEIIINAVYDAQSDLDAALLGFSVYGPDGQNIVESNTLIARKKIENIKKGQVLKAVWHVPNIFASGKYEVSVACCNKSATEFYDWLNKAGTFRINKEFSTTGVVNPEIVLKELTIEERA